LFSEQQAGIYAGLSLIGRVIFYATAPIGTVMFPVLVNRFNTKKRLNHILFYSIALVGLASLLVTIFYFLFPHFVILLFLKNNAYLAMVPYLGRFGLFITLFSMLSLLTYYFLSIKRTKISYMLFFGAAAQALLINFFHKDIGEIVNISIVTTGILFIVLLLYFKFKVK
jgi:O-antigen/teichoic acid export membrane protein